MSKIVTIPKILVDFIKKPFFAVTANSRISAKVMRFENYVQFPRIWANMYIELYYYKFYCSFALKISKV